MAKLQKLTLLLVDDDNGFRRSIRYFLEQDDFCVIEAVDGLNALEVAVNHGCRIDVVVTDFRMPRLNGIELAKRLKQVCPGIPLILVSGSEVNEIVKPDPELTVVRKPFNPYLLVEKVRELLGVA
jgi:DNA-binding NtrC family response regulator